MKCSLCGSKTRYFEKWKERQYDRCEQCQGILMLPEYYLSPEEEKLRYQSHNNDVEDPRYRQFVNPVTAAVQNDFTNSSLGLDYGCGTGPVAATELKEKGYQVNLYDPYFEDDPQVLELKYEFIICCEVMEHFYDPAEEFRRLYSMLLTNGKLYCKTSLYNDTLEFSNWYYKNDPTHVFFYTKETLEWIQHHFGFRDLEVRPDLIIFGK